MLRATYYAQTLMRLQDHLEEIVSLTNDTSIEMSSPLTCARDIWISYLKHNIHQSAWGDSFAILAMTYKWFSNWNMSRVSLPLFWSFYLTPRPELLTHVTGTSGIFQSATGRNDRNFWYIRSFWETRSDRVGQAVRPPWLRSTWFVKLHALLCYIVFLFGSWNT